MVESERIIMSKLYELQCEEFLAKLASEAPTPGGGGAAGMAGALAAALSSMVANLTIGKKNFEAVEAEMQELLAKATVLRGDLLDLVEQDAAVFGSFMACYKMPKSSEEEKQARQQAIRSAAKQAATVPMNIARASAGVVTLAERLAQIGNPNVITDATCSALLGRAAFRCAVYNVYINLNLTKDEDFNEALKQEIAKLQQETEAAETHVVELTDKALA